MSHGDAPALRFLLLCLGGWVLLRVLMNWSPAVPVPLEMARPVLRAPPPMAPVPAAMPSVAAQAAAARRSLSVSPRRVAKVSVRRGAEGAYFRASAPVPAGDNPALQSSTMSLEKPGGGGPPRELSLTDMSPLPARASLAGWSLSGWLYLRGGGRDAAPGGIAASGQIGGSQAGFRIAHGLDAAGRSRAYGRATVAVHRPRQRELALGIVHTPVAGAPFDVAIERRVALGREGRDAFAAMVTSGVSAIGLPAGFRLDAYGQAGIVGARSSDGFADGAVIADHALRGSALRFGALAAGAVQPGASRVDVGPRLAIGLPRVGKGARLALDWRQRVAGDARPESGMALTLAGDF